MCLCRVWKVRVFVFVSSHVLTLFFVCNLFFVCSLFYFFFYVYFFCGFVFVFDAKILQHCVRNINGASTTYPTFFFAAAAVTLDGGRQLAESLPTVLQGQDCSDFIGLRVDIPVPSGQRSSVWILRPRALQVQIPGRVQGP